MNCELKHGLKLLMFLLIFTFFKSHFLFAADKEKPGGAEVKKVQASKEEETPPQIPDPAVAEIHRQLNDIIQIHKTLQLQTRYKVREIQKITDQAEAHRKLLAELEAVRAVQRPVTTQSFEDIIRAEKIRQIQLQTVKNRQLLEEVRAQSEQIKITETVRMVEQARKEREEKEKKEREAKEKSEKEKAQAEKLLKKQPQEEGTPQEKQPQEVKPQEKKLAPPPASKKPVPSKEKKPSFKLW